MAHLALIFQGDNENPYSGQREEEQKMCPEVEMAERTRQKAERDPLANVFTRARRHLARNDPVMKRLTALVGRCTLRPGGDPFRALVRAVVAQMISTQAARAINARIEEALGQLCPDTVLTAGDERLRGLGLSWAKATSLTDLARRVHSGELPLAHLSKMEDDEVIERLVAVRGIGRWTAEMFQIFSLGRLDVLPVDDFGLRAGVRDQYALEELPGKAALRELAEPWRPYRSVATWYLWRSRGFVPQSA
jgi:DNA-3-methyladenine glycosylase II